MERDDLVVNDSYALNAHHSDEDGVKIRKRIYFVTVVLTIITTVEVGMGIIFKRAETYTWEMIKWSFIILTLIKAGYIVMSFMHLGEERRNMKMVILLPYASFILYLLMILILEATYTLHLNTVFH
jgi:cytochrome c oxidase subunit IV